MTSPLNREELHRQIEVLKRQATDLFHDDHDNGDTAIYGLLYGLKPLIDQYAQQVAIEELKDLREATKQITHIDAHIYDVSVAQGIRVHTNALLERRIAELDKERKQ